MNDEKRKEITSRNEDTTADWFKHFGLKAEKLDKVSKTESADWHFYNSELSILCEVKTIFSGGQIGRSREQHLRAVEVSRESLERAKRETPPETTLIVHKEDLDFANGKFPYIRHPIDREEAHKQFCDEIKTILGDDNRVKNLPFDITISFNSYYVPRDKERKEFIDYLIEAVLWADKNHLTNGHPWAYSKDTYPSTPAQITSDSDEVRTVESSVQIRGPFTNKVPLRVGFIEGGTAYNEQGIAKLIEDAASQLAATPSPIEDIESLRVIGVWSQSINVSSVRIGLELLDLQEGEIPTRYYIFDWIFEQYPDLAGIIFFELRDVSIEIVFSNQEDRRKRQLFPYGMIINNPSNPTATSVLKATFDEHCYFIEGFKKN